MNQEPIFSVIMPTYNRKNLIKRAIDSILAQTLREFELIIVDDGSTDNTKEFIDTYNDERIVYLYKENGGLNSARNMALKNARGEYIAFCDSDDSWMPEKLEKHFEKYNEDDEIKVVYDYTGVVQEENEEQKIILARKDICEGWCYKEVLEQGYLTSPTFLSCKKECFDKTGILAMDLTHSEDDDFCFRLCKHFKVGLIKEILGIYYVDAPNKICSMERLCADDFLKFLNKWAAEIRKICGEEVLKCKYFQAAYNYLGINEIEIAKEIYEKACRIDSTSVERIKGALKSKLCDEDKIIIYGIGEWGRKIHNVLKMMDFHNIIFTVTSLDKSTGKFHAEEIHYLETSKQLPVVIASSKYYDMMISMAEREGFVNIISYQEIMDIVFDRKIK